MLERVFHRAFTQAMFNGRSILDPRDLLISILSEQQTPASVLLRQFKITRENVVQYLADSDVDRQQREGTVTNKPSKQERLLKKFCSNLNISTSEN